MILNYLVLAVVGIVVIVAIIVLARPRWDIVIVASRGSIQVTKCPDRYSGKLIEFLKQDVMLDGTIKILAVFTKNGMVRTKIVGSASPGLQQQIRNYFVNEL